MSLLALHIYVFHMLSVFLILKRLSVFLVLKID